MSGPWQCGRCGTSYGLLLALPPASKTAEAALRRAMTQKTLLSSYQDLRRILFAQCRARACPATPRALLWRLFGRRYGRRPSLRQALRSLRHGDPLL